MNLTQFQQSELKRLKQEVEEILRDKILYIGNEIPEVFTTDKRDKQLYLGYPQQLIDELNSSIEKAFALGKEERECVHGERCIECLAERGRKGLLPV